MHYFLIAFAATTLGAIAGIGGGLIIRPILSVMAVGKSLTSFTSAATVFSMTSVNSLMGKLRGNTVHFRRIMFLSAGSIAGAFAGAYTLTFLDAYILNIAFIFVLLLVAVLIIFKNKIPSYNINSRLIVLAAGLFSGFLAGLFGIGGGPFYMTVLLFFFGREPKQAAYESTFICFVTAIATLTQYTINGYVDFSIAVYTIPGGILGGILGSFISKRLKEKHILVLFCLVIMSVLINQIYAVLRV